MIDLNSAECIVRAAEVCLAAMVGRIAADPDSPLVPDLQLIADHAHREQRQRKKELMSKHEAEPSIKTELAERLCADKGHEIDLDAIQAPLPVNARMDAYYYGFDRTGVGCIDAILSAVAIAGKGSHHTQSWGEDSEFGYYKNRPGLPDAANAVGLIQEAAAQASGRVTALLALVRESARQSREQARKLDAVTSIAVKLGASSQVEDRKIAEDLYKAMGLS